MMMIALKAYKYVLPVLHRELLKKSYFDGKWEACDLECKSVFPSSLQQHNGGNFSALWSDWTDGTLMNRIRYKLDPQTLPPCVIFQFRLSNREGALCC